MALRTQAGDVLSIRACAQELRYGRLALVRSTTGSTTTFHTTETCPVHGGERCLQTYLSSDRVASWSLRTFWSWRSRTRTWGEN